MMIGCHKFFAVIVATTFVAGILDMQAQTPTTPNNNVPAQTQSGQNTPLNNQAPSPSGSINGLPSSNASQDEISRFCGNIDSQAADARFELQSQQLQQLRTQIDERIKVLEEKRQDYENWLNKRNEFLAKAQDSLVNIISKMRPDAAAAQLALVDDFAAASIILKLSPRVSSAIMNELPPEKSANLTKVLVSAQKVAPENKPEPNAAKVGQ